MQEDVPHAYRISNRETPVLPDDLIVGRCLSVILSVGREHTQVQRVPISTGDFTVKQRPHQQACEESRNPDPTRALRLAAEVGPRSTQPSNGTEYGSL